MSISPAKLRRHSPYPSPIRAPGRPKVDVPAAIEDLLRLLPCETYPSGAMAPVRHWPPAETHLTGTDPRFPFLIRQRGQVRSLRVPPVVLLHQLYDLGDDLTHIDRAVDDLCTRGLLTKLRLGRTEAHQLALIKTRDYHLLLARARERCPEARDVLLRYAEFRRNHPTVGVVMTRSDLSERGGFSPADVEHLVGAGVALDIDADTIQWTILEGGDYLHQIHRGRRDLLGWVRAAAGGEVAESFILAKSARDLTFGRRYYIHDLVGSGALQRASAPGGALLRLPK
ncbi:Serine/threonine-protein kinase 19 [Tieghemiomyces parasiticus]|uniref:Serine/threonine-protein kinase 19 n=1 Tax=Tieghemiomyces parasiticus TaxID=78921 RepID=A0A9W8DW96_9FUNG|nr:Serine/threonine-protein kinase 19 [Tieghemiomyces parasiticus]